MHYVLGYVRSIIQTGGCACIIYFASRYRKGKNVHIGQVKIIVTLLAFARVKRQHPQQAQQPQQAPVQSFNYRPYQEAPDRIKQLLQLQQAREPLVHLPAVSPPQLQQLQGNAQHRAGPPPQGPQQSASAQPAQYSPNVRIFLLYYIFCAIVAFTKSQTIYFN